MPLSRTLAAACLCVAAAASMSVTPAGPDYSWALDSVNRSQIREYLKVLAKEPHLAGLERDEWLAQVSCRGRQF